MERTNLIWNINRICAYDCAICCIDGFHVSTKRNKIRISSSCKSFSFERDQTKSLFDDANCFLQNNGLELDLKDKFKIIENIDVPIKMDISGGDPLIISENYKVIAEISRKIGKRFLTISTTGKGFAIADWSLLRNYVENIEFTYDYPGNKAYPIRPSNFNAFNLHAIRV